MRAVVRAIRGADLGVVRSVSAGQGPLYLVEVELELANPSSRLAEADLELRLPNDARITRLALAVGGVLREAAVLPRADAVAIYQDITRWFQDPALLERDADEVLRLRVAPIAERGRTQVVFSYVGFEHSPDRRVAARSDERWIARLELPAAKRAPAPKRLRVLIDTSASMSSGFEQQVRRSRDLLAALAGEFSTPVELELVAFDQGLRVIYDGPLAELPDDAWAVIRAGGALGATRLADALKAPTRADRVLVITDGRLTEPDAALLAAGESLARAGVDRLDVVTFTNDDAVPPSLRSIRDRVRFALPQRGVVEWLADRERLVRRLTREAGVVPLDVPGAAWWWPREVELAADEVLLLARSQATPAPVLRDGSAVSWPLVAEGAEGPLFERMWQAHLVDAELAGAAADPAATEELARRTAELGVLTPLTAFLAFESEDQERRYGVAPVTAPIVTIDGGEVVVRPPTGAPMRGARLGSVPAGAAPQQRFEFNSIRRELAKKAREEEFRKTIEWAELARVLFEAGALAGIDELRAELDALLEQVAKERREDDDREAILAFLRPFVRRVVDSRGDACHFAELKNALRIYAAGTRPYAGGAAAPLKSSISIGSDYAQDVVRMAVMRLERGDVSGAVRALGSLADLEGPLVAAAALDTLAEGRALATALLRELPADDVRPLQRRLLAESRARAGAFAEAFALLAAPLPVAAAPGADWSYEQVGRWLELREVAADLRLLGARWAAKEPRRKAALARDVERLTGQRAPDSLVIEVYSVLALRTRSHALHAFDGRGGLAHVRRFSGDDGLQSAQLRLSAGELPSALEIAGGRHGEWVRIDMFDATGPEVHVTSRVIILADSRTSIDLPAHLVGRAVCPTPTASR